MYAAVATRPDVSYAVAALSGYNSSPFTSHMTADKRVLQFLKSAANVWLHYNGNGIGIGIGMSIGIRMDIGNSLVGYIDCDWANDSANLKAQGGHVFHPNDGAISWQSRKQSLIAMSTLDAEYIACSQASREVKWLLQLPKDIHSSQKDSQLPPINCDNQEALTLITTGTWKLKLNTSTFAITSVDISIDDAESTTPTYTQTKMWQIYSPMHLLKHCIRSPWKLWV